MKRWQKAALVVLVMLLVSQLPFIYRRYQLGRLHGTIENLAARRTSVASDDPYVDYRGVLHVHSLLGGHSTGRLEEIVAAARSNALAFVVMTEHPAKYINTAEATLKGFHEGILFINGSELNPQGEDRLLIVPGGDAGFAATDSHSTQDVITRAKATGKLVFLAYPEQFRSWELSDYDGVEIYNLYTNTKKINYGRLFFDGLWSYWSYPHLLFATFYETPTANLKKWDEAMVARGRRIVAVAGNDAHANVGLSLGHATGEKIIGLKLDPYERSFRVVRTHALIEKGQELTPATLSSALARGNCYISFDLFCDASGFRFAAESQAEKKIMGDEITLTSEGVRLIVTTPVKSRIVILRDGGVFDEEKEVLRKELRVNQRGVYRAEIYLDELPEPLRNKPWIISNPIYIR